MTKTKGKQPDQSPAALFEQYLREHRKRQTVERRAILEAVAGLDGSFTADGVAALMAVGACRVARPTVYATLELLVDCGILRRRSVNRGAFTYETAADRPDFRIDLICSSCGKIRTRHDADMARYILARRQPGFTPADYSLQIYGLCRACGKSRNRSSAKK